MTDPLDLAGISIIIDHPSDLALALATSNQPHHNRLHRIQLPRT
jgi:hypothetical protein